MPALRKPGALSREKLIRRTIMILITGASGNVGKTVLQEVAKSGAKHKAMYRSGQEAAKAPKGTETVIADFAKPETLTAALKDVDSVYLVCSPIPELAQLESNMIDACAASQAKHVVLNSAMGAGDYDKSFPSWHRKVEEKLKGTRLGWTILRPNSFHQNVLAFYAPTIRTEGVFYSSMRDAKNSFLDVRDIATVAAKALSGGEHTGEMYELNGPEAINYTELAKKISKVAGREVKYVDLPMDAQKKAMMEQGMPEWLATALLDLQQYYLNGRGGETDGLLQKLLRRPPITMEDFLRENASEFRPQTARA
jgi:uncharacterized protein YbjT (DUF2867 family)